MKAPIMAAQAMQHPNVVETINTLSQLAEELRAERDSLLDRVGKAEKDAARYQWLRKALSDRSSKGKSHHFCSIEAGHPEELDREIDSAMEGLYA